MRREGHCPGNRRRSARRYLTGAGYEGGGGEDEDCGDHYRPHFQGFVRETVS